MAFLDKLWRYRDGMIYLSPAPLYHAAPQAAVSLAIDRAATAIIMESFDAELYLQLVETHKVTHSQLVPTMFSRMLKLPDDVRRRYDLSSLEIAIHAAAPCPVPVKEQMIAWWGPIIDEYYGATEGLGFAACDSTQWLAHKGTVGKVLFGELHVLDAQMNPCPTGTPGTLWFKTATPFEYFNDPIKTADARSRDGTMSTVGDVGYVDEDGYLYLTDRATFMIISGGVNIYPQECENLLITHPKVADAAVFGVPNEDLGEEVKAAIQLMPGIAPGAEVAQELMAFCAAHLARQKCPRSIDFETELPRLPTGKLYKRLLRDRYWQGHKTRIYLERNELWFDRHPALAFLFEHDLFGKPDSTFPDHAPGCGLIRARSLLETAYRLSAIHNHRPSRNSGRVPRNNALLYRGLLRGASASRTFSMSRAH